MNEHRDIRLTAAGNEMTAEQHDAAAREIEERNIFRTCLDLDERAQAEEHRNMAAYLRRRDRANAGTRRGE